MSTFRIGARVIGRDAAPFVIAEMSGNHNQSLERALGLVDAAADAGAGDQQRLTGRRKGRHVPLRARGGTRRRQAAAGDQMQSDGLLSRAPSEEL